MSKSSKLWAHGASAGLVVNNEDSLEDMQRGKADDTSQCHAPTALIAEKAGLLIHLTTLREHQAR